MLEVKKKKKNLNCYLILKTQYFTFYQKLYSRIYQYKYEEEILTWSFVPVERSGDGLPQAA